MSDTLDEVFVPFYYDDVDVAYRRNVDASSTLDWLDEPNPLALAVEALSIPDGGFTLVPETLGSVRGGYAVGIAPEATRVLGSVTVGDLLEFLVSTPLLAVPGTLFGGWHDPADGRIYLDVSVLVEDRDTAIRIAKDHDQLAVFDFATGESIPTY